MENEVVSPVAFVCPPDFTEFINTEGLCVEDINAADNDIWIIQAPPDVDLMKLNNQHVSLNGPSTCHSRSDDGITEIYDCKIAPVLDKEKSEMHLVLPKRSSMELHTVKKEIKGIVNITKKVHFPYLDISDESCVEEEVLSTDMKKRCQSYGPGDSFNGNINKKGVKGSVVGAINTDGESSRFSRNLSENSEHSEDIPVKSKKKHKKHKHHRGDLPDRSMNAAMLSPESTVTTCEETSIDDGIRKSKKKSAGDRVRKNGDCLQLSGNDSYLSQNDEHSEGNPVKSKKKHRRDKECLAGQPVEIEMLIPENSLSMHEEASIDDGIRKSKKKSAGDRVRKNGDCLQLSGNDSYLSQNDEHSEGNPVKSKKKHRRDKECLAGQPVEIEMLIPENSLSTHEEASIDDSESGKRRKKKYVTEAVLQTDSEPSPRVKKNRHSKHDEKNLEDIHKKKHSHEKGAYSVRQIKTEMPSDDERNLYSSEDVPTEAVKKKEKKKKKKEKNKDL